MQLTKSTVEKALRMQFIRFLLVGVLNTIFGYGIFALVLFAGGHYAVAALVGTIAGVIFNFFTTGKIVFASARPAQFAGFVLVYGVVYLANVGGLYLLDKVGLSAYISGALLLLPLAVLSFVLLKAFVFRTSPSYDAIA